MVGAVRAGTSLRQVARDYGVSLLTVQRWVARAGSQRLDRVNWDDRSSAPATVQRTAPEIEQRVIAVRHRLREESPLGEYGAVAIHRTLAADGVGPLPAVRTIHRILERHDLLDRPRRPRRTPPPVGWYLPRVAAGDAELDLVDLVEGLVIKAGPELEVLTAISLHGGLAAAWPLVGIHASDVVTALTAHWQAVGRPAYVQFDNDTRFSGPHQHPDVVGRVMRLCLSLEIVPVFVPPREYGFQAAIESLNGRWQAKVWSRFEHRTLADLHTRSTAYISASRQRHARRIEAAPARRPIPASWQLDLQAAPVGRLVFLRRIDPAGGISVLGRTYPIAGSQPHRLVRVEVDLDAGRLQVYQLRRRTPFDQPLLHEQPYQLPQRRFRD